MSDPVDFKGMPQSLESERMILGVIFNRSLDFSEARAVLDASDFALSRHRTIYSAMEGMQGAGIKIDAATVHETLKTAGAIEACGGLSYLIDLDNDTPRLPQVDQYLKTVKNKSLLRKTVIAADSIRNRAILEQGDPEELLGQAQAMLVQLGIEASSDEEYSTPGDVIRKAGSLQKYLDGSRAWGIRTGFDSLDRMTHGMKPGHLWIIGGYTGTGKSTLARNIALRASLSGNAGAFITLEMGEAEVTDGWICAKGGIDSQILRANIEGEISRIREASSIVSDLPLYIRDRPSCTLPQLHGGLRKLKAEKGIKYAVIDYLQLIDGSSKQGNRTEEVSRISRGLKVLAGQLGICIVALSQLKRPPDVGGKARRPQLSDLRESGSIEQDANMVALIYSEQMDADIDLYPTELIIAKQRGGPTGLISFGFHKAHGIFREIEYGRPE